MLPRDTVRLGCVAAAAVAPMPLKVTPGPVGRPTLTDSVFVVKTLLLSMTVTLKEAVPARVGVPESVPSCARLRPAGRFDPTQPEGGVPPVTASLVLKAEPSVAGPRDAVVMTKSGAMVTVYDVRAPRPLTSVALM